MSGDALVVLDGPVVSTQVAVAMRPGTTLAVLAEGSIVTSGPSARAVSLSLLDPGTITIRNAGTISSVNGGVGRTTRTDNASSRAVLLENSGQISAEDDFSAGAHLASTGGGEAILTNTGVIRGDWGVRLTHFGTAAAITVVSNTGLIEGRSLGIESSGNADWITNDGRIVASRGTVAIDTSGGNDRVVNHGTIIGDIRLSAGEDTFDGRGGTVVGTVFGGAGNDIYRIDDGAIRIAERAGEGADTVEAAASFVLPDHVEVLLLAGGAVSGVGNGLPNTLTSNGFDNRLDGLGGDDTIDGGAGADWIDGDEGNDVMRGGGGDDVVWGARGTTLRTAAAMTTACRAGRATTR